MKMNKQPEFFALFCDDVRLELGGTQSIIGVLQDAVLVEEFPLTIPRLSVFFYLHLFDSDLDQVTVELQNAQTGDVLRAISLQDIDRLKASLSNMGDALQVNGMKVSGVIESGEIALSEPLMLRLCVHLTETRTLYSSSRLSYQLETQSES